MALSTQPLNISIVGAGVGGLTAAAALRRSGHRVQIFEALAVKREVGAGLSVQVNSLRVLRHLGITKEGLKGVDLKGVNANRTIGPVKNLESSFRSWSTIRREQRGYPFLLQRKSTRNDLHEALLRVAGGEGFEGPPAKLHLGSKVVACDVEEGNITLANGQVVHADLILAADGMNGLRTEILGQLHKSIPSGFTVFRAIFDAARLGPDMGWVTDGLAGTRMVSTCSGGSIVNIVGLHEDSHQTDPAWSSKGTREEFLEEFKGFNPKFQSLISLVDKDVIKFQLRSVPLLGHVDPRPRYSSSGMQAHGSLPALGQGAGMAIEEGGALGCLFPLGTRREDVPARLAAFQTLRKERGEFVNIESLEQVTIPAKRGTFAKSREMQAYILEYDAIQAAQECYQEHFGGKQ
ncbi:FAD/NAD(P)-binding domain-containing protein [Mycena rebaudengoi]|nr:FAD/NAD(P)-binding domain-containing protein [Mycena rebaudengoi]